MLLVIFPILFHLATSANILGFFVFPSFSHQQVFQQMWKELSQRGHHVTVITPNPLNDSTLTNLTEISVSFTYQIFTEPRVLNLFDKDFNSFQITKGVHQLVDIVAEEQLKNSEVKKLLLLDQKFDLILLEHVAPNLFALGHKFKAPVIAVTSTDAYGVWYEQLGSTNHPVLFPDFGAEFSSDNPTLFEKLYSIYFFLSHRYYYRNWQMRSDDYVKKYFGKSFGRSVDMFVINKNLLLHHPRPDVPTIVPTSPIHIKSAKPLPKDLAAILEKHKQVIYISFGSILKTRNLDDTLRMSILRALSEVPYTVLWKWDDDVLPGKPPNVILRKWFPQADLLAHPSIKAFVTHGGQHSIEESISREVPLIVLPFYGNHPSNAKKVVKLGIGEQLNRQNVSHIELRDMIIKVVETKSYKQKMKDVRIKLYDKSRDGLESFVWWCEYVIRHNGTKHLKSPVVDASWYQYVLLDVAVLLLVIGALIVYLVNKLFAQILYLGRKIKYRLRPR